MRNKKYELIEKIEDDLKLWGVVNSIILGERSFYQKEVSAALIALEKEKPSMDTLHAVRRLVDAVLSEAFGRDPAKPWLQGIKEVRSLNKTS